MVAEKTALQIRPAQLIDLDALMLIETSSFQTDKIQRRQMRYMLTRGKALCQLAAMNSYPVGYGLMLTPKQPRPARLYSLAVLPDYRGRHIGKQLLESLLDLIAIQGYQHCRLEVRANAESTIALYKSLGFQQLEVLPGYYADGATGIRMVTGLYRKRAGKTALT